MTGGEGSSFYRLNAKTVDSPLDTFLLTTVAVSQTSFGWMGAPRQSRHRAAERAQCFLFSGQKVKSDGGMTWKLSANPHPKIPSGHLHHRERKDKKKKAKQKKPHMTKQTPPPGLGGRGRAGRGRTVRSDPPPSARRPPTHGVKMGEKGMFS